MKKKALTILFVIFSGAAGKAIAQSINWADSTKKNKLVADLHTGYNYGFMAGIGYGYKMNTDLPLVINGEFSAPFGNKPFDDFKIKLGGIVEVATIKNFSVSLSAYGIFRRYQSAFVTLAGFGSEFSTVAGYYRRKWYFAGEAGFDKAIVTHIKNSALMKENYPGGKDGWYLPTGGNFFYGIRSGISVSNNDVYLKIGKTASQDLRITAIIPYYCQVGITRKFRW